MAFDFLEVFNGIALSQKAVSSDFKPATSLEDTLDQDTLGLDSLDITLTFAILGDAYGIPPELNPQWPVTTLRELKGFVLKNRTQRPEDTYESVKEMVKDLA